jgi:hypothetical protein
LLGEGLGIHFYCLGEGESAGSALATSAILFARSPQTLFRSRVEKKLSHAGPKWQAHQTQQSTTRKGIGHGCGPPASERRTCPAAQANGLAPPVGANNQARLARMGWDEQENAGPDEVRHSFFLLCSLFCSFLFFCILHSNLDPSISNSKLGMGANFK